MLNAGHKGYFFSKKWEILKRKNISGNSSGYLYCVDNQTDVIAGCQVFNSLISDGN